MDAGVYAIPGINDVRTEEEVFNKVCEEWGYSPEFVMENKKSRLRPFVEIRQVSMYIFRRKLKFSFAEAANFFEKDHATAISGCKQIENLREVDKNFRNKTNKLLNP